MLHVVEQPGHEVDHEPRLRVLSLFPDNEPRPLGKLSWLVVVISELFWPVVVVGAIALIALLLAA